MSKRANRRLQEMARRYEAQIPMTAARVRAQGISPTVMGVDLGSRHRDGYEMKRDSVEESLDKYKKTNEGHRERAALHAERRIAQHPGTSLEATQKQFDLVYEYYDAICMIVDQGVRGDHAQRLDKLLEKNERTLALLVHTSRSDLPRPSELKAVIVRFETAKREIGYAELVEGERSWRQRPWVWEKGHVAYHIKMKKREDHEAAYVATGIRVPRPIMLTHRIEELARRLALCWVA